MLGNRAVVSRVPHGLEGVISDGFLVPPDASISYFDNIKDPNDVQILRLKLFAYIAQYIFEQWDGIHCSLSLSLSLSTAL